ncbi:MAG: acyl carrier protein [Desulfobacteraceae bacterium]|nr:MAG: acyl carrier protein [Desulfobacteraceae bacterium]
MDKESYKVIEESLIREVAAILSVEPGSIEPEIPLHEMGIDSLGFVELLVVIEKKYKIKLMESGLTRDDFRTIRSLSSKIGAME